MKMRVPPYDLESIELNVYLEQDGKNITLGATHDGNIEQTLATMSPDGEFIYHDNCFFKLVEEE